jgi:hypothetical protein
MSALPKHFYFTFRFVTSRENAGERAFRVHDVGMHTIFPSSPYGTRK